MLNKKTRKNAYQQMNIYSTYRHGVLKYKDLQGLLSDNGSFPGLYENSLKF